MSDYIFGNILLSSLSLTGIGLCTYLNYKGYDTLAMGCLSASILFLVASYCCIFSTMLEKRNKKRKEEFSNNSMYNN